MIGLFGRGRYERAGFQLYTAAVTAARDPYFYSELGVPDTLDGRFDLVGLYACMVIRRLRSLEPAGPKLAQAVFDAMFSDMDINLREMGVSDMALAKRVRAMWEAFHGRALAYEVPLASGDVDALATALVRNVWRGRPAPAADTAARIAMAHMQSLQQIPDAHLLKGDVSFGPPHAVLAAEAA